MPIDVLGSIGHGADNARPLSDIAESLGVSRRAVEKAIQEARLAGEPIASGRRGVWLADDLELAATIASLERRLATQYLTLRKLRQRERAMRAARYMQTTLFTEEAA